MPKIIEIGSIIPAEKPNKILVTGLYFRTCCQQKPNKLRQENDNVRRELIELIRNS